MNTTRTPPPAPAYGWPASGRLATVAQFLNVSESWLRVVMPCLSPWGLRPVGLGGPKWKLQAVVDVLDRLAAEGRDINIDQAAKVVRIGTSVYPIDGKTGTGKTRRGRPRKADKK